MEARYLQAPARLLAVLGILLTVASCQLVRQGQRAAERMLSVPAVPPSALLIITDPDSASAMREAGALIDASARPGEWVFVISIRGGAVLASSQAPQPPTARVPVAPAPPAHATSFEEARYRQARQYYQSNLLAARAALQRQERQQLTAWATSTVAAAQARLGLQRSPTVSIRVDLSAAISEISSLRQAGAGALNTVIVIAPSAAVAQSAPGPLTGLQASTVIVDGFPGDPAEEFAWQASLLQGGARRALVLTPATDGQLATVVQQGLDGAVTDTLSSVLFGSGQYQLEAAALPQLKRLLYLLAIRYPDATASIDGYTDSLPVRGGNLQLSSLRAMGVQEWLTTHGVAAGRLQAFGYGDTDPVAPNTPDGQPLNRRVVVVIDPAVPA
jgi:outer membrane protein OmpA-like peptidoglycan-associated protein